MRTDRQRRRPGHPAHSAGLAIVALLVAGSLLPATRAQDARVSLDGTTAPGEAEAALAPETSPAFARIRFEENGVHVIRHEGYEEDLVFNAPLYPGDRLETGARQRVEVQLPDGTLVRVDRNTVVEFFGFADPTRPDDPGLSLLGLVRGNIQVDVPDPRGGRGFRVDTPAASVYPLEPTAFRVDVEPGDRVRVSVERGRAEVAGEHGTVVLVGGMRTRVVPGRGPRRPWSYNVLVRDGFDAWVAARDDVYRLRAAPGPEYRELPEPVRPYYGELSRYGEWIWVDGWGWCWHPDEGPDWRPYVRGRWVPGPWGPVWVGAEPWGFAVYHYGRWEWYASAGWVWIPGTAFAPAWVTWYYGPRWVGWCPLGWYDAPVHVSIGFGWGWGPFDHHPWVFVGYHDFWYVDAWQVHVHHVIVDDLRRGVISRRAILPPRRGRGPRPGHRRPRPGARPRPAKPGDPRPVRPGPGRFRLEPGTVLARAERIARTRPAIARRVTEADPLVRPARKRGFREVERDLVRPRRSGKAEPGGRAAGRVGPGSRGKGTRAGKPGKGHGVTGRARDDRRGRTAAPGGKERVVPGRPGRSRKPGASPSPRRERPVIRYRRLEGDGGGVDRRRPGNRAPAAPPKADRRRPGTDRGRKPAVPAHPARPVRPRGPAREVAPARPRIVPEGERGVRHFLGNLGRGSGATVRPGSGGPGKRQAGTPVPVRPVRPARPERGAAPVSPRRAPARPPVATPGRRAPRGPRATPSRPPRATPRKAPTPRRAPRSATPRRGGSSRSSGRHGGGARRVRPRKKD